MHFFHSLGNQSLTTLLIAIAQEHEKAFGLGTATIIDYGPSSRERWEKIVLESAQNGIPCLHAEDPERLRKIQGGLLTDEQCLLVHSHSNEQAQQATPEEIPGELQAIPFLPLRHLVCPAHIDPSLIRFLMEGRKHPLDSVIVNVPAQEQPSLPLLGEVAGLDLPLQLAIAEEESATLRIEKHPARVAERVAHATGMALGTTAPETSIYAIHS